MQICPDHIGCVWNQRDVDIGSSFDVDWVRELHCKFAVRTPATRLLSEGAIQVTLNGIYITTQVLVRPASVEKGVLELGYAAP